MSASVLRITNKRREKHLFCCKYEAVLMTTTSWTDKLNNNRILFLFFSVGQRGGEHGGQSGGVQGRNGSDRLHVQIVWRRRRDDHTVVLCELSLMQTYTERYAAPMHVMFIVLELYESLGDTVGWEAENLLPWLHREVCRARHTVHRPDQCEWYRSHWRGGVDYQQCAARGRTGIYLSHQRSNRGRWRGTYKAEGVR